MTTKRIHPNATHLSAKRTSELPSFSPTVIARRTSYTSLRGVTGIRIAPTPSAVKTVHTRHVQKKEKWKEPGLFQMSRSGAVSLVLIAMILARPVSVAYAEEIALTAESVPAVGGVAAVESPAADTSTPGVSEPAATEQPASESNDSTDTPPVETVAATADNSGEIVLPASGDVATTTEASEPVPPLTEEVVSETASTTDTETPADEAGGGTSGAALPPEEHASSTDATEAEVGVSDMNTDGGNENVLTDVSADTEIAVSTTDEAPVVEETFDQRLARELSAREETMRNELRKQVETEYTNGCLSIDNVGYYCLKNSAHNSAGMEAAPAPVSAVYSDVGESGNKEIFYSVGGETKTLTSNAWDDVFPAKDVAGGHIVWQGQKDGRWQIFFADLSSTTPAIVELTHNTESNFNPRVDGNNVVWQSWTDNNWEIFLASRLSEGERISADKLPADNVMLGIDGGWRVIRITTDAAHDMFPSIAGGFVTWQRSVGGVWGVYVYDTKTGMTAKLSKDGTKSENPRFTFVWDERTPEGDMRLIGYDVSRGESIDLTKEARSVREKGIPYAPLTSEKAPEPMALPGTNSTTTATSSLVKPEGDGGDTGGEDGNALISEPELEMTASSTGAVVDLSATTSAQEL